MDSLAYGGRGARTPAPERNRGDIYLPEQAVIRAVIPENPLVKTFVISLADELANSRFTATPGQFVMVSMPHLGEAPISFSGLPDGNSFRLTIRNSGSLTRAAHRLQPGDVIGLRGPLGNGFPMETLSGRPVILMAGGIGLAPLRPVLEILLAGDGNITLLHGCRSPRDFCFQADFDRWRGQGLDLRLTVDSEAPDWRGRVGLVTELLGGLKLDPGTRALVCGPGIMIRFAIKALQDKGMPTPHILTTLERRMKCGVGICGHCHSGGKLICLDGPVFPADQLPEPDNP